MPFSEPPTSLGPGSIVRDKWRLDAVIGRTQRSEIFAATHRNSRRFALKILSHAASLDPSSVTLFLARGYASNQIGHRGVVHALDDDRTLGGRVILIRDLVDGETLLETIAREGPALRPTHVVETIARLLEVLAAAHEAGIVHGRLAPEHVLVERDERVRLIGFRAALHAAHDPPEERGWASPVASPEHASNDAKELSPASDVWSVGALAYSLLTGQRLRPGTREPVRSALPQLSEHVAALFDRAVEARPAARWQTANEMLEALNEARDAAVRVKTGPMRAVEAAVPSASPQSLGGVPGEARRSMPIAVAVPLEALPPSADGSSPALTGLVEALRAELGPDGLRIDEVAGLGALVVPPALKLAREEAFAVARAALKARTAGVEARFGLVLAQDLLTHHAQSDRVIAHALREAAKRSGHDVAVDPAVAFLLEGRFLLGRAEGVTTLLEEEREATTPRLLGSPTTCVGREREIASLAAMLPRAAADKRARAAVLIGPSGIGKSRLVHEAIEVLRQTQPGAEVWIAKAESLSGRIPLGMIRDLVRQACSFGPEDAEGAQRAAIFERIRGEELEAAEANRIANDLAGLCGVVLAEDTGDNPGLRDLEAGAEGDRVLCAFQDFVAAVVRARPLAIVLEDVQWADQATLHAIDRTLEHLHDAGWALVATARPEIDELAPQLWAASGAVHTKIGPLEDASLASLARGSLGRTATDAEISGMVKAASGNALHLEERIRARAEGCPAEPNASLEEVVRGRVASLGDEAKRTVALASVFGQRFWFRGLGHLLRGQVEGWRIGACLDELTRRELIIPSARSRFAHEAEFAFRHGVIEAEAYALLSPADRDLAHRLAGEWLERTGERDAAVLAAHFARSEARAQAAAWDERSAVEALGRNDIDAAIAFAERGLSASPSNEVALSLHGVLAESHGWRADYVRASAHARKVVDGAKPGSASWCQGIAVLATALGRRAENDGLVALIEHVLAVPPPVGHERSFSSAIATLVSFALRMNRHDLLRGLVERVATLETSADPVVVAYALHARSWCAMFAGDFSKCLELDREVVRRFDEAGDLRTRCRETTSIGYDLMVLGDYALAEKAFRAALATAERLGVTRVVFTAKQHLCPTVLRLGRVEEALRWGHEALEIAERGGDVFATANVRTYLAEALAASRDYTRAVGELARAVADVASMPATQALPLGTLARVNLTMGDLEAATHHATTAMAILAATGPAEEGDAEIRLVHAEALDADGHHDAAVTALTKALRRVEERASRISDPALRRSFLERVPEHARTIQIARRWGVRVAG